MLCPGGVTDRTMFASSTISPNDRTRPASEEKIDLGHDEKV